MVNWRESASQEAQDDLDGLLGPALEIAHQQLEKNGEFYPFALVLTAAGEHEIVAASMPQVRPDAAAVLGTLDALLRARRDELRAAAIITNFVFLRPQTDSVRVTLEHREGANLAVLRPYSRRRFRTGVEYGPLQATTANPQLW